MKYILVFFLSFAVQMAHAQKQLPDSTIREFSRLICECATLMQVDQDSDEKAFQKISNCISSTIPIFEENDWIKKEWLSDSVWVSKFDDQLQQRLSEDCDVFKKLIARHNRKAPDSYPTVDPRYFLSAPAMEARNMVLNANAGNPFMQRWSAKDSKTALITMVFDIRFIFPDEKDAADYFEIKMDEMGEGGTLLNSDKGGYGADEARLFGANEKMAGMFGDLDMSTYNFVFRIKNVVAKVFVSGTKKTTYADAVIFAREAAERIRAVK
jgi:hypothetical protein